jgi:hypothetical protein
MGGFEIAQVRDQPADAIDVLLSRSKDGADFPGSANDAAAASLSG